MPGWWSGHWRVCAAQVRGLDRPGMALLALLLAALMWPGLVCMALVSGDDSPMAAWPALLFGLATTTTLLLLTARVWLNLLLMLPLLLFQPVEWYAVHTVHSQVSPAMFAVFLLTNVGEASDFLADRWLAVAAGASIGLLALGGLWWTFWRRRVAVPLRLRLSLVVPLLLAACSVAVWRAGDVDGIRIQAAAAPCTGSAVRFAQMLRQRAEVGRLAEQRTAYRHDAVATRGDVNQLVILVIGESLRADRLGINGCPRQTTPRLAARAGLITLTDVAACSHLTNLALPPALTGIQADDHALMNRRSSLVAACREAGFATCWLSNQAPTGRWDELVASYAGEADMVRWMNPAPLVSEWGRYRAYDDKLVAPAAEVIASHPGKTLIVLHTLGSHLRYELRYPPEQAVFQPATAPGAGESYSEQPERMRNAYDNSVLATDAMLDACIALHERSGRPGFVMFVADHGESLYDDGVQQGHGCLPPPAVEFRVPWLLWPSQEERRLHPQAWAAVEANRTRRTSTQDAFQTLLHLGGITIREADPARCLGSTDYRERPRLLIDIGGRLLDFDRDVAR